VDAGINIPKAKDEHVALDIFELEETFENYERDLIQFTDSIEKLKDQINRCSELEYTLKACMKMFTEEPVLTDEQINDPPATIDVDLQSTNSDMPMIIEEDQPHMPNMPSVFVTGVIAQSKISSFVLLVNRVSRGNSIPRFADIEELMYDSTTKKMIPKAVFIVFFSGQTIREKIRKITQSMSASIYDFPNDVESTLTKLATSKNELYITLNSTTHHRNTLLIQLASNYEMWFDEILTKKAVFNVMNMFDYEIHDSAIAEGWIPTKYINTARDVLIEAQTSSNARLESFLEEIPTHQIPPTLYETDKFTYAFQEIVNAYGVPRYKEINPAVFTIITFPFLFAIMFGDWGHGIILTSFALALIIFERKLESPASKSELFGMVYQGRYIILLMGLFSIFTGLLYNDIFGLAIDIFGTSYPYFELNARGVMEGVRTNDTYVFGVDAAWYGTSNKLLFYNSLKMKMSVIFGIGQMTIGIILAGCNMLYFRHIADFFVEFIPELLILMCTFGYMCILIIVKWCRDWSLVAGGIPAILPTMTDFFLKFYDMEQPRVYGTVEGKEQHAIQVILLVIAVIMIPILLIPKPIIDHFHEKRKNRPHRPIEMQNAKIEKITIQTNNNTGSDDQVDDQVQIEPTQVNLDVQPIPPPPEQEQEQDSFSEKMIKQLIHTIEYVLGVVSNTASYLRLWALSLAHAQLSEVFWDMTMNLLLSSDNEFVINFIESGFGPFFVFIIWFILTVAVLLMMESLSAFLHALRLHWVEFQNKFFVGDGYLFEPFDTKLVIKEAKKLQLQEDEEKT
jgi:V-type H+-transporting ATPase subunit a